VLPADLDGLKVPRHIAIIMDGNGRWAQQRGLPRLQGHYEGRKATRRVVQACVDVKIEALSVYAFSVENWSRPLEEVEGLLELMATALEEELTDLCRNEVRLVVSGRLGEVPEELQQVIQRARRRTAENQGLVLNLLINYGGRAEISDAARAFARRVQAGEIAPEALTEQTLREYLYRPELADPDLVIRPGGEQRISNFLLWEIAYSELVYQDVLWPDYGEEHLLEAIREYSRRQRRYGGVVDTDSEADQAC
jgi:undecaprenyl diphosphate synthase